MSNSHEWLWWALLIAWPVFFWFARRSDRDVVQRQFELTKAQREMLDLQQKVIDAKDKEIGALREADRIAQELIASMTRQLELIAKGALTTDERHTVVARLHQWGGQLAFFRADGTYEPRALGRHVAEVRLTNASDAACYEIGRERAKLWGRQCPPPERVNARTWGVLTGDLLALQGLIGGTADAKQLAAFDRGFADGCREVAEAAAAEVAS